RPGGAPGGPGVVAGPELGGMVALQGILEAEAGQALLAALDPWPAPVTPTLAAGTSAGLLPWSSWPPHPGGRPAPPERRGGPPAGRGGGVPQAARGSPRV